MDFQTRSYAGELRNFSTFKEALDFAESSRSGVKDDDWEDPAATARVNKCVWKISFPLPTGERVRLVREEGKWVLRQMDDELARIRAERLQYSK